jgi:WD40 repeat protein
MAALDVAGGTWFYARDKQKHGPLSWEQLRDAVNAGGVRPDDMVLQEGNPRWIPAKEVPGLFFSVPESLSDPAGDVLPSLEPSTVHSAGSNATVSWVRKESQDTLPAGRSELPRVPGYELLGELGKGGMGIVYKARQAGLNRIVALKMIRSGMGAGHEERERFRAEAQAVARLQHPNIVQIFEIGEWIPSDSQEPMPFFSLEFVSGGSLAEKLGGQPQPPRQAAEMVETLAKAMHHAHAHGIVHRDLKPANVLLAAVGLAEDAKPQAAIPKITDFGLAKELDADSARTRAGAILGTPSYMSPEQAEGNVARIGPLTDVYALGAILYEMLTGRPPFRGTNAYETMEHVRTRDPVPPAQLQPGVPRDLETICVKCLQKDPQKRYASAEALAEDVRAYLDGKPIRARPVGRIERAVRWCRRSPLVASLLVLLVFVFLTGTGLVLWQWNKAVNNAAESQRNAAESLENANEARGITADLLLQKAETTGQPLLSGRDEEGDRSLFFLVQAIEKAIEGHNPGLEESLRRQLAAWLHQTHRLHGQMVEDRISAMALSPDGKRVWFTSNPDVNEEIQKTFRHPSELICWDLESVNRLYSIGGGLDQLRKPAISPGGRWGLLLKGDAVPIFETATGEEHAHFDHRPASVTAACFEPDSRHVLIGDNKGQIRRWSIDTEVPVGSAATNGTQVVQVVVTPNGKRAAVSTRSTNPAFVEISLWSLPDLKLVGQPLKSISSPGILRFGSSSRFLYVGSDDGKVHSLDSATGAQAGAVFALGGRLDSLAVDQRDELLVLGGSFLKTFQRRLPNLDNWLMHQLLTPRMTKAVGFSPDNSVWFAAGGSRLNNHGEVRLHMLPTYARLGTPLRRSGMIWEAQVTSDGKYLVAWDRSGISGDAPSTVSVWALQRESLFGPPRSATGTMNATLSGSGRLAFFDSDDRLEIWNTETEKPLCKPIALTTPAYQITASNDDKIILVWERSSGMLLNMDALDRAPQRIAMKPGPQEDPQWSFSSMGELSGDGRKVVSGNTRDRIHVWDFSKKPAEVVFHSTLDSVTKMKLSPSGRFLVVGGGKHLSDSAPENRVEFWDLERSQLVAPSGNTSAQVTCIRFTADSQRVWLGTFGGEAQLWDVPSGTRTGGAMKQAGSVISLSLSQDEKILLVGNIDMTARVWNVETQRPVGPAIKLLDPPVYTLLTPDGKLAAVADQQFTVRLWDVGTGRTLGPSVRTPGKIMDLGLSASGTHMLIGCAGGKVIKYPLPVPEKGTIAELTRRVERLTGTTLDEHGELRVLSIEEWGERASGER